MKNITVTKRFTFDAAHNIEAYHGKCERLHGHTYTLEVSVKGLPDKEGMVIDFCELKRIVKENIIDVLDHVYINEVVDFNPSSENLLHWMAEILEPLLSDERYSLHSIALWETPDNKAQICI